MTEPPSPRMFLVTLVGREGRANHTLALTGFQVETTHVTSYISLAKANHTCTFNIKGKCISPVCLEAREEEISGSSYKNTKEHVENERDCVK